MSKDPRDTQFAGFARLLYDELARNVLATSYTSWSDFEAFKQEQSQIIARRAYDLVNHVLSNEKLQWYPIEEISMRDIPDLKEWPKESE